jgi:hypothetical protein
MKLINANSLWVERKIINVEAGGICNYRSALKG